MSHEADSSLSVIVFLCPVNDSVRNAVEVVIACEKRLTDRYLLKGIGIISDLCFEIIVFKTVHKVCRLNNELLYFIGNCSVKCLLNVIYDFIIAAFNVVDDDICCEAAAYRKIGKCVLKRLLDSTYCKAAAVIEACTEAEHKKLVFTDAILISWVVEGSIAGIVVLLFFLFRL